MINCWSSVVASGCVAFVSKGNKHCKTDFTVGLVIMSSLQHFVYAKRKERKIDSCKTSHRTLADAGRWFSEG